MKSPYALVFLLAGCTPSKMPAMSSPTDTRPVIADPLVGTGGFGFHFASAFPGAAAPQGLAKVGPDTSGPQWGTVNFLHYSGYWYSDDTIQGFSHLHLHGTGATDYGVLTVMPGDGFDAGRTTAEGYASKFHKASESASPGYYGVTLDRGNIKAEITATVHGALHRYTFPSAVAASWLVFDLDHHLNDGSVSAADVQLFPSQNRIRGHLHSLGGMSKGFGGYDVYFDAYTSQPWTQSKVWSAGAAPTDGMTATGTGVGLALAFARSGAPVSLRIGLSFVSADNAAANLAAEIAGFDFDALHAQTAAAWNALLGTVKATGGTVDQQRTLLASLYHAFLMPTIESDVDGSYIGPDKKPHHADGYRHVTDMSLWDTYRTLHPLYSLIAPDRASDSVRSLLEKAKLVGYFFKWPIATGDSGSMIGASAELVVADAYLKGIGGFDPAAAYALLQPAAMSPMPPAAGRGGRSNSEPYLTLGYIPSTSSGGSVSLTTEFARDDYALSQLARALGKTQDADALLARSNGYRKLFDPDTSFLWPKKSNGSFDSSDHSDPTNFSGEFVEANAWQTLWACSHDIDGMMALFGGQSGFIAKLTEFFEKAKAEWDTIKPGDTARTGVPRPYYWGGNEPDIHAAYLFAQAGRPDLTQKWAAWARAVNFSSYPDGLPGNDDGGTMSAWFVFSAIGLYPQYGTDKYILGAPLFPHVEVSIAGGTFTIDAPGVSDTNLYVQSVTLDGAPVTQPMLAHKDLHAGGHLLFTMGPAPSSWGRSP